MLLHRMHTHNSIPDHIKLLIELLNEILIRWLDCLRLAVLILLIAAIHHAFQLSILLQPLFSILNKLIGILANLWPEFWRLRRCFTSSISVLVDRLLMQIIASANSFFLALFPLNASQTGCWFLEARCERLVILVID